MMDERTTLHGMSIDDAYVVERRLAHGPAGTTELVTLGDVGPFVRKRLPRERAHRMVWAALAACESPRLPRIQTTYELPDEFVVVCDYVSGETLAEVVERTGALASERVCALAADLCEALDALHAHGVVHRDVAPANIVLAEDGAHLIDFGCAGAPALETDDQESPQGTWGFAAPEQHGFTTVDARADLYAVGRVAAYAATGALSEGNSARELRAHIAGLPEGLRRVIERACAFEPSARYQTAAELGAAFAAACAGDAADGPGVLPSDPAPAAACPASVRARGQEQAALRAGAPAAPLPDARSSQTPFHRKAIMLTLTALAVVCALAAIWLLVARPPSSAETQRQAQASTQRDDAADGAESRDSNSAHAPASDASASDLVEAAVAGLTISESSWYVSNGFVHYAVAIHNASESVVAVFPTVLITGKAEDGSILFSSKQVLNDLYPGETRYWGSIAGNGSSVPDTVEFTLSRPGDWEVRAASDEPSRFTVSNVSISTSSLAELLVTGEVTLDSLSTESIASQIQLVAIGRDAQGNIVFGFESYASLPSEGDSVPFEISSYDDVPEYETVEVYAYAW